MATVAIDFDGPVHWYRYGWQDGVIYDDPTPGAFDAIRRLQQDYAVVVFTCRDAVQVADWLTGRGIPTALDVPGTSLFWNDRATVLVTNRKPAAVVYIDDRGIRFSNWAQTLADFDAHETGFRARTGLDRVQEAVTRARGGPPPAQVRGFA